MSNREPTIPIDVKYNLLNVKGNESEHPFDKTTFDPVLTTTISRRANIHQTAGENSCSAQKSNAEIIIKAIKCLTRLKWVRKVLLKNQRKMGRKGGKFSFKWFSSFTIHSISKNNLCSLINKDGTQIKTNCNVCFLKPYLD